MILKNQAKLIGKIGDSTFQLFSNENQVEINPIVIKVMQMTCHDMMCCCLKIKIKIENRSKETVKKACLHNQLPSFIAIIPCTLKINGMRCNNWYEKNRLNIILPDINSEQKMMIEFIITRDNPCCNCWNYFDNYSIIKVDNENYVSNKIRIYNGVGSDYRA